MTKEKPNFGVNDENLKFISPILFELNAIPFYGTLLGMVREGRTIIGDDDIDIIILSQYESELRQFLNENNLKINDVKYSVDGKIKFLQIMRQTQNGCGSIDFYFVEKQGLKYKDNFSIWGRPNSKYFYVTVEKSWFYNTKIIYLDEQKIRIPQDYQEVLGRIYGKNWCIPLEKGLQYVQIPYCGRVINIEGRLKILGLIYNRFLIGLDKFIGFTKQKIKLFNE